MGTNNGDVDAGNSTAGASQREAALFATTAAAEPALAWTRAEVAETTMATAAQ